MAFMNEENCQRVCEMLYAKGVPLDPGILRSELFPDLESTPVIKRRFNTELQMHLGFEFQGKELQFANGQYLLVTKGCPEEAYTRPRKLPAHLDVCGYVNFLWQKKVFLLSETPPHNRGSAHEPRFVVSGHIVPYAVLDGTSEEHGPCFRSDEFSLASEARLNFYKKAIRGGFWTIPREYRQICPDELIPPAEVQTFGGIFRKRKKKLSNKTREALLTLVQSGQLDLGLPEEKEEPELTAFSCVTSCFVLYVCWYVYKWYVHLQQRLEVAIQAVYEWYDVTLSIIQSIPRVMFRVLGLMDTWIDMCYKDYCTEDYYWLWRTILLFLITHFYFRYHAVVMRKHEEGQDSRHKQIEENAAKVETADDEQNKTQEEEGLSQLRTTKNYCESYSEPGSLNTQALLPFSGPSFKVESILAPSHQKGGLFTRATGTRPPFIAAVFCRNRRDPGTIHGNGVCTRVNNKKETRLLMTGHQHEYAFKYFDEIGFASIQNETDGVWTGIVWEEVQEAVIDREWALIFREPDCEDKEEYVISQVLPTTPFLQDGPFTGQKPDTISTHTGRDLAVYNPKVYPPGLRCFSRTSFTDKCAGAIKFFGVVLDERTGKLMVEQSPDGVIHSGATVPATTTIYDYQTESWNVNTYEFEAVEPTVRVYSHRHYVERDLGLVAHSCSTKCGFSGSPGLIESPAGLRIPCIHAFGRMDMPYDNLTLEPMLRVPWYNFGVNYHCIVRLLDAAGLVPQSLEELKRKVDESPCILLDDSGDVMSTDDAKADFQNECESRAFSQESKLESPADITGLKITKDTWRELRDQAKAQSEEISNKVAGMLHEIEEIKRRGCSNHNDNANIAHLSRQVKIAERKMRKSSLLASKIGQEGTRLMNKDADEKARNRAQIERERARESLLYDHNNINSKRPKQTVIVSDTVGSKSTFDWYEMSEREGHCETILSARPTLDPGYLKPVLQQPRFLWGEIPETLVSAASECLESSFSPVFP